MGRIQEHKLYSLITSELGIQMFSVVVLYMYFRKNWILHGITALILARIADIVTSWFLHVKGAQEIGQFRVWLVWWMRIGLNFAKDTAGGSTINVSLVAGNVHFMHMVGNKVMHHWLHGIVNKGRTSGLNRAKERVNQMTINHNNFVAKMSK